MSSSLYETDFYLWTQQQAEYLRAGKFELLDLENLSEEIESLGKQQRQELENRLEVLLGHLLKWQYQPDLRFNSWIYTIREQRREVKRLLQENPSLKPYLEEAIKISYENALDLVGQETNLDPETLPQSCPFSDYQIFEEVIAGYNQK